MVLRRNFQVDYQTFNRLLRIKSPPPFLYKHSGSLKQVHLFDDMLNELIRLNHFNPNKCGINAL